MAAVAPGASCALLRMRGRAEPAGVSLSFPPCSTGTPWLSKDEPMVPPACVEACIYNVDSNDASSSGAFPGCSPPPPPKKESVAWS